MGAHSHQRGQEPGCPVHMAEASLTPKPTQDPSIGLRFLFCPLLVLKGIYHWNYFESKPGPFSANGDIPCGLQTAKASLTRCERFEGSTTWMIFGTFGHPPTPQFQTNPESGGQCGAATIWRVPVNRCQQRYGYTYIYIYMCVYIYIYIQLHRHPVCTYNMCWRWLFQHARVAWTPTFFMSLFGVSLKTPSKKGCKHQMAFPGKERT